MRKDLGQTGTLAYMPGASPKGNASQSVAMRPQDGNDQVTGG